MSNFPILKYFSYKHLPKKLQQVSKPFEEVAQIVAIPTIRMNLDEQYNDLIKHIENLPECEEREMALQKVDEAGKQYKYNEVLRKLLEAKDCAVRAAL